MMKFAGQMDGNPVFGFGITADDLEGLKAGEVRIRSLATMDGPDVAIVFLYGETDADVTEKLQFAINDATKIIEVPASDC